MEVNYAALFEHIEMARTNFIDAIKGLSTAQVNYKYSPEEWSVLEIAEHMVWAERAGVIGMWKAIHGIRNQQPIWEGSEQSRSRHSRGCRACQKL